MIALVFLLHMSESEESIRSYETLRRRENWFADGSNIRRGQTTVDFELRTLFARLCVNIADICESAYGHVTAVIAGEKQRSASQLDSLAKSAHRQMDHTSVALLWRVQKVHQKRYVESDHF